MLIATGANNVHFRYLRHRLRTVVWAVDLDIASRGLSERPSGQGSGSGKLRQLAFVSDFCCTYVSLPSLSRSDETPCEVYRSHHSRPLSSFEIPSMLFRSFANLCNVCRNFIIGVSVPPMLQSIDYGTYIFFAAWCFIAAIFAYFLVPETSNKTLEELDEMF